MKNKIPKSLKQKYSWDVINALYGRKLGFNDIKKRIRGISATTLSKHLQIMQAEGMVLRTVVDAMPPTVSYTLTEKGVFVSSKLSEIQNYPEAV